MKHIETKTEVIYPVGLRMLSATRFIDEVVSKFNFKTIDQTIVLHCRGSSGAILSALLASKIDNKVKINHVKKEGEESHNMQCNLFNCNDFNIIIDDFVSSGTTIEKIITKIEAEGRIIDMLIVSTGGERLIERENYDFKYLVGR